jgi:hypothetical protein
LCRLTDFTQAQAQQVNEFPLLPLGVEVGEGYRFQYRSQKWADFNDADMLWQVGAQGWGQVDGAVIDALAHDGAVSSAGWNPRGSRRWQQTQLLREGNACATLAGEQQLSAFVLVQSGIVIAQGRGNAYNGSCVGIGVEGCVGIEPGHGCRISLINCQKVDNTPPVIF